MSPLVGAIDGKYDESFFSGNDILFYNPEATTCASGAVVSGSGAKISLTKSPALQAIFQDLLNGGLTNLQVAAVMGNMQQESHFDSNAQESNGNGYGLVQWSNGRKPLMKAYLTSKGVPVSDVATQIEYLFVEYNGNYKAQLAGTAFAASTDLAQATEAWMRKFEVPLMSPANDPAALNSIRIPAAIAIYGFYKDLTAAAGSVATSPAAGGAAASLASCSSANGAVAGSIVDTALGLALDKPASDGMTAKSDAKPSYQVAMEQFNPGGAWSDCGRFVATVMIASGVDTNYAKAGTGVQADYVRAHPEKYKIISSPTLQTGSDNTLQPGDILISSGHTEIYTGKSPYPIAEASLNSRVPAVSAMGGLTWMLSQNPIAARIIK